MTLDAEIRAIVRQELGLRSDAHIAVLIRHTLKDVISAMLAESADGTGNCNLGGEFTQAVEAILARMDP